MPNKNINFSRDPISKFLQTLGSSAPFPGGGSGAALTGAIGVSLIEMVARINARREKKNSGHIQKNSTNKIDTLKRLRLKMEKLVTLDAKAFMKLSKYFKKEKTDPSFQHALKVGAHVPLEICEVSAQALQIGLLEKDRTSRWLASDLAEAGILLRAAFESARLNVEINLKSISDKNFSSKVTSRLDLLEKKTGKYRAELTEVAKR